MKDFLILLKTVQGSASGARIMKRKRKGKYTFASSSAFGQIFSGLIVSLVFGFDFYMAVSSLNGAGPETVYQLFGLVFIGDFFAVFGLTSAYVVSVFFLSDNEEALLPFPIRPSRIFAARSLLSVVFGFIYSLLFLTQGLILLVFFRCGPAAFVSLLIIFLTLPFIGMGLGFVLSVLVGLLFRIRSNRKSAVWLSIFYGLTGAAGLGFTAMLMPSSSASGFAAYISGLYANMGFLTWAAYLPSEAVLGPAGASWVYLLLYLAAFVLLIGLVLFIADRFYFRGLASQGMRRRKKLPDTRLLSLYRRSFSALGKKDFLAYIRKELKTIRGTPYLLINSFLLPLLMTVIMLITVIPIGLSPDTSSFFADEGMAGAVIFSSVLMSYSMPFVSYVSVSAEGRGIAIIKSAPVDVRRYLFAKSFPGAVLAAALSLTLPPVYVLSLSLSPALIAPLTLSLFPALLAVNRLGLILGIRFARFDYDNPAELMQRGAGPFLLSILSFLLSGFYAASAFLLAAWLPQGYFWAEAAITGGFSLGLFFLLRLFSARAFSKLTDSDLSF